MPKIGVNSLQNHRREAMPRPRRNYLRNIEILVTDWAEALDAQGSGLGFPKMTQEMKAAEGGLFDSP